VYMYMVFLKILKWHRMYYQISLFVLFFNFLFFFSFFINFVYNNYLFIIYSSLTHNNLGKLSLSWSFSTFYTRFYWAQTTVKHIDKCFVENSPTAHLLIKFWCSIKHALKVMKWRNKCNYWIKIINIKHEL